MRTYVLPLLLAFIVTAFPAVAQLDAARLSPEAQAAWEKYVRLTEARVENDLKRETTAPAGQQVNVQRLRTLDADGKPIEPDGAMIHHWKGTIFVPDVKLSTVLQFVQDYAQHDRHFQEVEKSRLVSHEGDTFRIFYRLKRTKILTVVYNTDHTVVYRRVGDGSVASRSVTTKIAELDSPGTASEHEKAAGQDRGFLWRLNSYWRFTEKNGGVVVECESISLSRGIPTGFGWLVRGYVESVPRESLVNTLTALAKGVKNSQG